MKVYSCKCKPLSVKHNVGHNKYVVMLVDICTLHETDQVLLSVVIQISRWECWKPAELTL